jgi:short-subunit dehydrogenase
MTLSKKEQTRLKTRYGTWALITGASSGIGLELAKLLAEAGFNLIINSRHEDKLQAVKEQLSQTAKIEIKIVACDVSDEEGVQKLKEAATGIDIGLLVASAGFGTSGKFLDNSIASEINMLRVNCEASLALAHHFAQVFVNQKRGGIILLSSIIAFQGSAFAANYAATKAYIQTLAEGLAAELKPSGVDVLSVAPGPVETGFSQRANMKMPMTLKLSQVGVPILKALGRQTTVFPGYLSKLMAYGLMLAPRWLKVKIMSVVMSDMTKHQKE